MHGFKYVLVHAPMLSHPITIPTFLKGMPEFVRIIALRLSSDPMLTRALRDAG
jgi:hypothetical protein